MQSQASLVAPPASDIATAGDENSAAVPDAAMVASARSLHGDPWFTEVIELRKRAKDYMVRWFYTICLLHCTHGQTPSSFAIPLHVVSRMGYGHGGAAHERAVSQTDGAL